jgi:hypothetical protein
MHSGSGASAISQRIRKPSSLETQCMCNDWEALAHGRSLFVVFMPPIVARQPLT